MADPTYIKISELPVGIPQGTDETPATDPTDNSQDPTGTTKKYIRSDVLNWIAQSLGLATLPAVRVGTVSALTAIYDNGVSGVGATLTNSGVQSALMIDGIALQLADRVLVKDQINLFENGIYTVSTLGTNSTNWVLTRAIDYDEPSEIIQYAVVLVNAGDTQAGILFQETSPAPFVIGVSDITFSPYGGSNVGPGILNHLLRYDGSTWVSTTTATIDENDVMAGLSQLSVDNIDINGNSIISTDTNGNLILTPNGTGDLVLDGLNWPQADGTVGQRLTTDGAGQLSWEDGSAGSPGGSNTQIQYNNLGAFGGDSGFTTDGAGNLVIVGSLNIDNLQINANSIISTDAAGDINLTPDTTGNLVLDGLNWPQADGTVGQILSTDGAGQLSWVDDSAGNPGGSNTQIQYNNVGVFGGDSGFTTDGVGNVSLVSIDIGSTTPITGFINDDTMATASTSNASSSTAIVNYIASQVGGSGGLQSFQIFTTGTAATYTTPGGITSILVEVLGGGGGGGGVAASGAGAAFAGGGGAGGYARLFIATAASSYTYTVGAGGAGGTAGANPGTTGGTTSFGASLQATGGAGGTGRTGAAAAAIVDGGTGGVGSSGDINCGGMPAMFGVATSGAAAGYSGSGASSIYGGGGRGSQSAAAGTNAQNYGSGGSGAATGTATNRAGGNGSTGLIIVWEFA